MPSLHRVKGSPFWHCFFTLPDGRRTHRSTGETDKRKALAVCLKFVEAAEAARHGRFTEARARQTIADIYTIANAERLHCPSVRDYLATWLERKRIEVSEKSFTEYEGIAADFIEGIGEKAGKPIDALTARDAAAYRDRLARRVSGVTVNKSLKVIRGAWARAMRDGLLRENVFARVDLVKTKRADRRAFTLQEVKRILEVCGEEWRGLVLFGFYTGQRLGDIARLTWQNVDLHAGEMRLITRKTQRRLIIPLPRPLVRYLLTLPANDNPEAPLFPNAANAATSTLSRQFSEILASIGLAVSASASSGKPSHGGTGKGRDARRRTGGLSFHCLRHTTTSALKSAGVNNAVAMELIGHESEAISRTYTHIEADSLRAAVNKLPDLLPEKTGAKKGGTK